MLESLSVGDSKAILYLQDRTAGLVFRLLANHGLPDHLAQEILNDAVIIFIKKLREPGFVLTQAKPTTYFAEIVKLVVSNKTRTRQFSGNAPLEQQADLRDNTVEEYYTRKENREVVALLLAQTGEPCGQIIRLKYLDGYSDDEVIQGKMVSLGTVDSLRVKRSECMKRLREAAQRFVPHLKKT